MNECTYKNVIFVFGVKNIMRLEAKAANPCADFINGYSHTRKICQQTKRTLKTGMISICLILTKLNFCFFVDIEQIGFSLA